MKQEKGVFLKGVDVPPDVNRIMGHDSEGHYILERVTIHTDGTPDEWVRTYYEPCPTSDGMNVSQVLVDEWIGEKQHGRDGKLIEKCKEAVKSMRESGVTDELVLVVPYMLYMGYIEHVWEKVKEETGVDHVEKTEIGFPNDVEAMVVQRSEYLRMFIKSLGEKESE